MTHADVKQVNGKAFNDTFGSPGATMVGLIVAIYESNKVFKAYHLCLTKPSWMFLRFYRHCSLR